MQKRTEMAVMTTIRNMDLVVETKQRQLLAKPGIWETYAYEVALTGMNGPIRRYRYPTLGTRSAHFVYNVEDFVVPETMYGGATDAAFNAAYNRFKEMSREIEKGGKPL